MSSRHCLKSYILFVGLLKHLWDSIACSLELIHYVLNSKEQDIKRRFRAEMKVHSCETDFSQIKNEDPQVKDQLKSICILLWIRDPPLPLESGPRTETMIFVGLPGLAPELHDPRFKLQRLLSLAPWRQLFTQSTHPCPTSVPRNLASPDDCSPSEVQG